MSKTGKILIIAPEPFYEDRGTPIAIRQVIESLSKSGRKVDLLTFSMGEDIDLPGLRIIRVGKPFSIRHVPIGFSYRKVLLDAFLTIALKRLLKQTRYDCIHAVEEAAFAAAVLGQKHNIPVLYDMQSSMPEQMKKHLLCRSAAVQNILRMCERWLIRRVDIIACSSGLKKLVHTIDPAAQVREWRFASENYAVSEESKRALRRQLGISHTSRVVLYCGSFESYQGLDMLADAYPLVLSEVPDTVFVFVGSNQSSENIKNCKGIIQVPKRPKAEIPRYLAMSDVLVSPRENSCNLPLKVFEYMAAGKPIVATDTECHRTVLDDNRAILVKPSAGKLAKAIVQVLKDPGKAKHLGCSAQAYARENLNWTRFNADVSEIYDSVTNGKVISSPDE